jgi:hypothetical protein
LKKFGSVTVLNGHIHQIMQKVEGNVPLPYSNVHGISTTAAGQGGFSGTDESTGAAVADAAGN